LFKNNTGFEDLNPYVFNITLSTVIHHLSSTIYHLSTTNFSMTTRDLFLRHIAQTSPTPIGLEIVKSEGCYMWDKEGKKYLDLISGFSVMNMGHSNPAVIDAITKQINQYMHLMVYGEIIESPQVAYAKKLTEYLPGSLDCVYFTNSGTEATEGAMKLAKRYTNRTEIIAFNNSYHGSTQGALSIMGDEYWRNAYRPLLPGIFHLEFNSNEVMNCITERTACIIMEVVQAEAGVIAPNKDWLKAIRKKCDETGTLLVFDEIQTGFGRTGSLWAFEQYGVIPDILMLGKALGGGLPLGAFISSQEIMHSLTNNPVLGHISTFAGHPVSCAAGLAAFNELLFAFSKLKKNNETFDSTLSSVIYHLSSQVNSFIKHPSIKAVRNAGLLMAVEFADADTCIKVCHACIANGIITDWFLFAPNGMRVAPPLIMGEEELSFFEQNFSKSLSQVFG
jgi:acetylornithine/succinyldiaminopimelate/putrescine aminotransferase